MRNPVKNSILIVDDEPASQKFLNHLLGNEYEIYAARDGRSGLRKAKEVLPDLILLDIIMPGMSWHEVLAELKNTLETRDIPTIFITAPKSNEDEIRGLTSGASDYIVKPFNPEIVKLRVRNQIKIVNQIRTISGLSTTDQLTGLPNRRGFDDQMNREWGRTMREKTALSVLLIDVDRFKVYNDTYGHQQGDVVLQTVAGTLTRSLGRANDFAARWGGEEFIVLLPNVYINGALKVAERIRANVEQTSIPLVNEKITNVTISIGVNTLIPTPDCLAYDFISQADKALYAAKETGRNRVCHAHNIIAAID